MHPQLVLMVSERIKGIAIQYRLLTPPQKHLPNESQRISSPQKVRLLNVFPSVLIRSSTASPWLSLTDEVRGILETLIRKTWSKNELSLYSGSMLHSTTVVSSLCLCCNINVPRFLDLLSLDSILGSFLEDFVDFGETKKVPGNYRHRDVVDYYLFRPASRLLGNRFDKHVLCTYPFSITTIFRNRAGTGGIIAIDNDFLSAFPFLSHQVYMCSAYNLSRRKHKRLGFI
jgi:hypothetical protein